MVQALAATWHMTNGLSQSAGSSKVCVGAGSVSSWGARLNKHKRTVNK
jgi:transposase